FNFSFVMLSKIITLFILLYFVSPRIVATEEWKEPKCTPCDDIQQDCTLITSGFFCTMQSDSSLIVKSQGKGKVNPALKECVPKKFTVQGPLKSWCCLWSPETGCRQLAGHYYQNHSDWSVTCDLCLSVCRCRQNRSLSRNAGVTSTPTKWFQLASLLTLLLLGCSNC
ncbi:hypothetical protein KR009_005176, partial [Drosophila setifemur]